MSQVDPDPRSPTPPTPMRRSTRPKGSVSPLAPALVGVVHRRRSRAPASWPPASSRAAARRRREGRPEPPKPQAGGPGPGRRRPKAWTMSAAIDRRQASCRIGGIRGARLGHDRRRRVRRGAPSASRWPPPDAVAMLYDNTICTGCKACMSACNEANGLPPDTALSGGLWHIAARSERVDEEHHQALRGPGRRTAFAFVKQQCMHCLDPACVTACPFGALEKNKWGAVAWDQHAASAAATARWPARSRCRSSSGTSGTPRSSSASSASTIA